MRSRDLCLQVRSQRLKSDTGIAGLSKRVRSDDLASAKVSSLESVGLRAVCSVHFLELVLLGEI